MTIKLWVLAFAVAFMGAIDAPAAEAGALNLGGLQTVEPPTRLTIESSFAGVRDARQTDADLDCEDFATQEDAQAVLDEDAADPNNLDPNGDGIACALLPSAADADPSTSSDETAQDPGDGTPTPAQTREERRLNRNRNQPSEEAAPPTCADFATADEAQQAFDADPEGLAGLDADGNGIACEELLDAEPADAATAREARRANRRNQTQEEAPADVEVVIDDPAAPAALEDIDCVDFAFQEESQAVYDEDPADPYNLDPNGDGFACSSLPSTHPVVERVPRTRTGANPGASMIVVVSFVATLGTAALWAWRGISTSKR